jgi:hypothetical protein
LPKCRGGFPVSRHRQWLRWAVYRRTSGYSYL